MNTPKPQIIAAFDFDGTITKVDTLFHFIRFYVGLFRMSVGLVIMAPMLIKFKLGMITNDSAKQKLFAHFFKGEDETTFQERCKAYASQIDKILKPAAINKIKYHQHEQHTVIINSASICNWIQPWAENMGIKKVIGTRIEVKNGKITGNFIGPNCYGTEKVVRLLEEYPNRSEYQLYAYGDSNGDKPLLQLADYPFYRKY